jgi:hypothetical protein
MSIPPVPTIYNGVKYRSLLESRLARCLDNMAIPFRYEGLRYADRKEDYYPDFRLWPDVPSSLAFVELKPLLDDLDEHARMIERAYARMETVRASEKDARLFVVFPHWQADWRVKAWLVYSGDWCNLEAIMPTGQSQRYDLASMLRAGIPTMCYLVEDDVEPRYRDELDDRLREANLLAIKRVEALAKRWGGPPLVRALAALGEERVLPPVLVDHLERLLRATRVA